VSILFTEGEGQEPGGTPIRTSQIGVFSFKPFTLLQELI